MQTRKALNVLALAVIVGLIAAMGALTSPVSRAQGTPEATESMGGMEMAGYGLITGGVDGEAKRLNASGATFPLELYKKWIEEYYNLTGVEINYAGGGSGQGKKDIAAEAVDFAGSDSIMKDEEISAATGGNILHIATTMGAIVPVYNIPELQGKDPVKLTGENLANIYLGKITKWNDAALVADNPDLANVDADILPVYRSDGSGTTNNFTIYLSSQSQEWADTIKSGNTVQWPYGIGANGNPGVASEVGQTEYSIGYVELAFAKDLQAAQVKNAAGAFVTASAESVSAAAKGVELPDDMRIVIIGKSTDEAAWPISTFTWLLVYRQKVQQALSVFAMLRWSA
ncbi:MAG: phosphate ABC transporter substrate-binding protein PstS [Anaerolineae bacterium]